MLVYVIKKKKLISFTLPSKVYGDYWIKDTSVNGEESIINISEYNGKWAAFSNKKYKIILNDKVERSIYLADYQFLLLQEDGKKEFLVLYICPVNDSTMKRLSLKGDLQITIGRNAKNTISCPNYFMSDTHARLTYQKNTWLIEDLNSEYGTFVNDIAVTQLTKVNYGDIVFIMGLKIIVLENGILINNPSNIVSYNHSVLVPYESSFTNEKILSSEEDREVTLYDEDNYFVRSPRFMEVIETETFKIEPHPNVENPGDTPLLLTLGPMITMGSTSFVMLIVAIISMQQGDRSFLSVMPTFAIAIAMLAGTLVWPAVNKSFTKKQYKKKLAKMQKKYNEYLEKKAEELKLMITKQKQILLSNNISSSECYSIIINNKRSLWERELHQKDFLSMRLGIGKTKANIKFDYPAEHFQLDDDELEQKMRLIVENNKYIDGTPIVQSLIDKNIIAMTGKYQYIKNYMDLLILQIVALHSYYDLKIVLFTSDTKKTYWEYLKLMPHLFSDDKQIRFFGYDFDSGKDISSYLQKIMSSRKEKINSDKISEDAYKMFGTYYLIITDDYNTAKEFPIINDILNQNGNLGFSFLILNSNLANLPTECKAFISLTDSTNGVVFENELNKDNQREFTIESVNDCNLNYCSLKLANIPIKNTNSDFNIPKSIDFLNMYEVGKIEQLNALEKWKINNPINSLRAPVGLAMNGKKFNLDLHEKEQGPHGLIAGMTGSGKSEFIITYILSMAINYHPDEVQFVLIDYKGGGLVGAFENKELNYKLPHLAGTITNLETADINRALASIESELKRRQALFNEARDKLGEGTIDIYKYQRYYREGALEEPISHLFIISDEFAELKSQQPEFMDQLISTARIGRSLGVHLILATQKPSGIVNDQIWSNTRFRVCLKVQDASDSNEVIKRPDAADLKDVGRFYLQVGYNEYFAMGQAAYAGANYFPRDKVYTEIDSNIVFINDYGKSIKVIDTPRNSELKSAGEQLPNIVKYLGALATKEDIHVKKLWLDKIPEFIYVDELKAKYGFVRKPFNLQPILGEYDNPKEQMQGLLTLDLMEKGNTVIYSMDEKNTITNAIIYSLITTYSTKEVNVYIMDFDSETLKVYKKAPQVGDVVFINEVEKIDKLLKMLLQEIENRKKLFQDYNGSYEYYIKTSNNSLPGIVLMLSGYENFKDNYDEKDLLLSKISREGSKYGIYIVMTAISDRSLRLSMRSNFPTIIPLKLNAAIDYNMLLGKKAPTISDIDNRGIILIDDEPYEFQTASITKNQNQIEYINKVCEVLNEQLISNATSIPVLPEKVMMSNIINSYVDEKHVPIGIEEESLQVASYDFTKNLINLINSNDFDALHNFSKLLIKEIEKTKKSEYVVFDLQKMFNNEINSNNYINTADNIIENIKIKINAVQNKRLLIFITGIDTFINSLSVEDKNNMEINLSKLLNLNKCNFIIISRVTELKNYAYEKWFKQYVSLDSAIYIGPGINNNTLYNLTTPLRNLSFPIAPNFGYNIKQGIAVRMKVLEGDDINE